MKTRTVGGLLLLSLSVTTFAKTPNTLCVGAQGENFPRGDGTKRKPFLVCSTEQMARIGSEAQLLGSFFILGSDLNFTNKPFTSIGNEQLPFEGGFDGNGYALTAVSIGQNGQNTYVAPFANIRNARVENLTINGVVTSSTAMEIVGGLVGQAENSIIINDHVTGLNIRGVRRSGGLVGHLIGSTVAMSSTQGVMHQTFGADASGGLVGRAVNSHISHCSADVDQDMANATSTGISEIGGLVGVLFQSRARDVYATGDFTFNNAKDEVLPQSIGGIVGSLQEGLLTNAFYAGKMTITATQKGGAVGSLGGDSLTEKVFWDSQLSGVNVSAAGVGKNTKTMKNRAFWTAQEFDIHKWRLQKNKYPTLFGVN